MTAVIPLDGQQGKEAEQRRPAVPQHVRVRNLRIRLASFGIVATTIATLAIPVAPGWILFAAVLFVVGALDSVVDVAQNAQIWSGSFDAAFSAGELSEEEARDAVQEVLARFPDRASADRPHP